MYTSCPKTIVKTFVFAVRPFIEENDIVLHTTNLCVLFYQISNIVRQEKCADEKQTNNFFRSRWIFLAMTRISFADVNQFFPKPSGFFFLFFSQLRLSKSLKSALRLFSDPFGGSNVKRYMFLL